MRKLLLRNNLSLGDVVVCTSAIRDLHKAHPDKFVTGYDGSCSQVFENNPYIRDASGGEEIVLEYPAIHKSNERPRHFIEAYHEFLSDRLGVDIPITEFRGDIHLHDVEKQWISQIHEIVGFDAPFWLTVSGGKFDYTCKWWGYENYQRVVDSLRGKVLFVQVGELNHFHPPLKGVIDLRGKTDVRQLIRLMYHAQGVLCPVTSLMHLAAAVPVKGGPNGSRPCVVVAGGREPVAWEHYPTHQFLHTVGMLPCCAAGACWRSRTVPLGDNDTDKNNSLCDYPTSLSSGSQVPKCMKMITPENVVEAITKYEEGGVFQPMDKETWSRVESYV